MPTLTHIAIVLAVAVAAATSAAADGPQPGGLAGSVQSPDGKFSYIAVSRPHSTYLQLWHNARRLRQIKLPGLFGFPIVATDGSNEGVSHDGSTLILASYTGRFRIYDPRTFRLRQAVKLPRDFSYDALSPHARMLYLIQHVASPTSNRYLVRAYDLKFRRLLKRPIFDRRGEWKTVMSGWPVARATSANGGWVYTLYSRPGGRPFAHMLDAAHAAAYCVDLPWMRDQNRLFNMRLQLSRDERKLLLRDGRRVFRRIDTRTYRVS